MNKNALKKILEHPDKDEIITQLILGISSKDMHEWLEAKYTNVNEVKFIIPEKTIKIFQDNYLDLYSYIQQDIMKAKETLASNTEEDITLSLQNNITYANRIKELAKDQIDVRRMVSQMCLAIEIRFGQIFDEIQRDPNNINTRTERLFTEYAEKLGKLLETYYKFTEGPTEAQFIQNNVTLQVVDQHILILQEGIREVLSQVDLESSMKFMDLIREKFANLQLSDKNNVSNTDIRLAEAKLLSETINKKLNDNG